LAVVVVCQLRQLLDFCLQSLQHFQCLLHHLRRQPFQVKICLLFELKILLWPWDLQLKLLFLDLVFHPEE
jgi:hypothetical protein